MGYGSVDGVGAAQAVFGRHETSLASQFLI
jgi:hypothetical protein